MQTVRRAIAIIATLSAALLSAAAVHAAPEASGSATQATAIYFDEAQMHRPGEDLLGALRAEGLAVQLARCGPVYTQSTNNW